MSEITRETVAQTIAANSKGVSAAIGGGAVSVLGLAINEWMSIIGGLCAIIGVVFAYLNHRSMRRVHAAQIDAIRRGEG